MPVNWSKPSFDKTQDKESALAQIFQVYMCFPSPPALFELRRDCRDEDLAVALAKAGGGLPAISIASSTYLLPGGSLAQLPED